MSMTIKELADSIGVSKTAIRKRMTDEFRASYTVTDEAGILSVSDEGCKQIWELYHKQPQTSPQTSGNQTANFTETSGNLTANLAETTANLTANLAGTIANLTANLAETSGNLTANLAETSGNLTENLTEKTVSAQLVEMLQTQLDVKDKQIAELNARLAEMTAALTETQKSLQAAQALHAGTIQQNLLDENSNAPQKMSEKTHRNFWRRLFHKGE